MTMKQLRLIRPNPTLLLSHARRLALLLKARAVAGESGKGSVGVCVDDGWSDWTQVTTQPQLHIE